MESKWLWAIKNGAVKTFATGFTWKKDENCGHSKCNWQKNISWHWCVLLKRCPKQGLNSPQFISLKQTLTTEPLDYASVWIMGVYRGILPKELWVMDYGLIFPANEVGQHKNLWVTTEYGL